MHSTCFLSCFHLYICDVASHYHSSFLSPSCPNLGHSFKHLLHPPPQVVAPMAANYTSASGAAQAAGGPFSWVPKQMLSGDAADEEGESDGDSDRGDEDRGEGDEAELVIDIPNE